jgi:hypothetical protein
MKASTPRTPVFCGADQRGCAANPVVRHVIPSAAKPQPNFGLSLAKTQRPQRKIKNIYPNLAFLPPWRGEMSESEMFRMLENLPKPRKFSGIVVHAFSQTALGKRGSPVGEQPQPKT